jgi:hypothetical protein
MTEQPDPNDFHGIDKSEASSTQTQTSEEESSGRFGWIRDKLSGGTERVRGAPSSVMGVYRSTGDTEDDSDYSEERRKFLRGAAAGAAGVIGAGLGADYLSDGEIDGNLRGEGPIDRLGASGPPAGNRTETPTEEPGAGPADTDTPTEAPTEDGTGASTDTPTDTPTDTESPTDTPRETPTPEADYRGDVDGSSYQLVTVPGPGEEQGYEVDDDVLRLYDRDGWADITDESEYEELGTGTDWYITEDALIGVNEQDRVSRTFPDDTFDYDVDALYEDIAQEAE